jgi:L-ascorbate metabolism protein UlaG (beta-lactamase superfamily)
MRAERDMNMRTTYSLSPGARAIPLVNSWVAHPYLVAPLTFGLYTRHGHLEILESFIDNPKQHLVSSNTPQLRGGPFINYAGDPADIARFRDETLERCALHLRGADAINGMYQMLLAQAKGSGVHGLYAQIDELIRYGVDLSYDVCKQPGPRFIEPVFYDGPLCDTSLHTCVLERATDEPRAFALSTPQVRPPESSVTLELPFGDPVWDELYGGCADRAALVDQVRTHLKDPERASPILAEMLAARRPAADDAAWPHDTVRVRYFGHACVLMQCAGISILIDPLISYPGEATVDRFTFDDLPERIDYALITHPHQDHIVFETLLRLRHKIDHVIVGRAGGGGLLDVSLKLMLQHCGFKRVTELGEYESLTFEGGRIVGAPFYGEHADLDIRGKLAYGIQMKQASCLFFADSNPPAPEFYDPLKKLMPRIDCMFLGMECVGAPATWLYGPLLQKTLTRSEDQSRRLDGCDAAKALRLHEYFDPKHLFIYAMGAEPWLTHLTSILYSEETTQFKEARRVESTLRPRGRSAELLFGKKELLL